MSAGKVDVLAVLRRDAHEAGARRAALGGDTVEATNESLAALSGVAKLIERVQLHADACEHCDGKGKVRHPAYGGDGRSATTDCAWCAADRALLALVGGAS